MKKINISYLLFFCIGIFCCNQTTFTASGQKQKRHLKKHVDENFDPEKIDKLLKPAEFVMVEPTSADLELVERINQERKNLAKSAKSLDAIAYSANRVPAFAYSGRKFPTLSSWIIACSQLIKFRDGGYLQRSNGYQPPFLPQQSAFGETLVPDSWEEFNSVLQDYLAMMKTGPLSVESNWLINNEEQTMPSGQQFQASKPFAQKLIAQPGDQFFMRGDLHGDIYSLLEQLIDMFRQGVLDENFRIIPDRTWMVFLGDYVDRGVYGCEVLYTMMRLALANPDRVIFVRGNHETAFMNTKDGFQGEVVRKFGWEISVISDHVYVTYQPFQEISKIYNYLPVVLYLGCMDTVKKETNYLQCCHGGIEIGYDPRPFLAESKTYQMLGSLEFHKNLTEIQKRAPAFLGNNSRSDYSLGFQWGDFKNPENVETTFKVDRGYSFSKADTQIVLNYFSTPENKIRGIVRAHQHAGNFDGQEHPDNPENLMHGIVNSNGVYKLWRPYEITARRVLHDGWVWTFNVSPDTGYAVNRVTSGQGGFDFDVYAVLIPEPRYEDWHMYVKNTILKFKESGTMPRRSFISSTSAAAAAAAPRQDPKS